MFAAEFMVADRTKALAYSKFGKLGIAGRENIIGVGVSERNTKEYPKGELCLKVFVIKKLDVSMVSEALRIPESFEGFPTIVEEIGEVYAQVDPKCYAPARPGCSIGHVGITYGTLGCLVKDSARQTYLLSNNHVLAHSNDGKIGDFIVQPGPAHGGRHQSKSHPSVKCGSADNCIASLKDFENIDFAGTNTIDAAIATPLGKARKVIPSMIAIGKVAGVVPPSRRMEVRKRGATTELTYGEIDTTNVQVDVNYGSSDAPRYARFVDQIEIKGIHPPFSLGGDSGSLIVDKGNRAVGLLFAGNHTSTFANPIQPVLDRFKVDMV